MHSVSQLGSTPSLYTALVRYPAVIRWESSILACSSGSSRGLWPFIPKGHSSRGCESGAPENQQYIRAYAHTLVHVGPDFSIQTEAHIFQTIDCLIRFYRSLEMLQQLLHCRHDRSAAAKLTEVPEQLQAGLSYLQPQSGLHQSRQTSRKRFGQLYEDAVAFLYIEHECSLDAPDGTIHKETNFT